MFCAVQGRWRLTVPLEVLDTEVDEEDGVLVPSPVVVVSVVGAAVPDPVVVVAPVHVVEVNEQELSRLLTSVHPNFELRGGLRNPKPL